MDKLHVAGKRRSGGDGEKRRRVCRAPAQQRIFRSRSLRLDREEHSVLMRIVARAIIRQPGALADDDLDSILFRFTETLLKALLRPCSCRGPGAISDQGHFVAALKSVSVQERREAER